MDVRGTKSLFQCSETAKECCCRKGMELSNINGRGQRDDLDKSGLNGVIRFNMRRKYRCVGRR